MIDFFKKLMEQALDLELTVRFTKRDGGWFAALGNELNGLSPEELEEYRAELEARLCDMDDDEPGHGRRGVRAMGGRPREFGGSAQ